ncbi:MAG TPA: Rieske 2Fe-2S domain-containing protein [Oligoflexia bacterium]|nr:Rieske 2Fe-2S domain-containing protein [Oligoflexia bacterium]HMP47909.1 Rieske 2Fe-2S domain-containing protein [Oligoflexia bacterium]
MKTFPITRRDFLLGIIPASFLIGCDPEINFPTDNNKYELKSYRYFEPGFHHISNLRVGIFHLREEGMSYFKSIKLVCTHQSCALRVPEDKITPDELSFHCPCHGAIFNSEGDVVRGPAKRPLEWLRLSLSENKYLTIHLEEKVERVWTLAIPDNSFITSDHKI